MPGFYNAGIHVGQRLALEPWLRPEPGTPVLDVGCGVGRWSRLLAARGARVTGVDLSPTMAAEAKQRAERDGLGTRCRFLTADLPELDLGTRYPLIVGVTVLQHILDDAKWRQAIAALARHLEPGGQMVLLEAAPSRATTRCDSPVFRARSADHYLTAVRGAGLRVETVTGVDPAPFKILFLPHYARLPRPLALAGLALATAAALPIDIALGRRLVQRSWHKVFVLRSA